MVIDFQEAKLNIIAEIFASQMVKFMTSMGNIRAVFAAKTLYSKRRGFGILLSHIRLLHERDKSHH